ncbi:MAG: hypothetical protein JKY56_20960 [Kofleriaceae bacterium]|nr:hypothetical protein [Kofleriaceae bacterium]
MFRQSALATLLFTAAACGPRYQPSESEPQPPPAPASSMYPAPQATLGLARTEVPPDMPVYEPPRTSPAQPPRTTPARPPATPLAPVLSTRYQEVLDSHNRHRANHCAAPLQWSSALAARAQQWADQLQQAGCAFQHSQNSPYGENLYFFAPAGNMSPDQIATGWYDEVNLYNFNSGAFSMSTGHFTQLIWRDTQKLGCGVSMCKGGEIWVCNYDPPGNVQGYYKAQVLPTSCR